MLILGDLLYSILTQAAASDNQAASSPTGLGGLSHYLLSDNPRRLACPVGSELWASFEFDDEEDDGPNNSRPTPLE
jgi:hypothetical protein